ncbi:MAG: tetratricopeptide repeat protein [Bosea sp. (in: a-proteobacteria)]|jgi:tetratricopeptide (TPR) repeat protein|uniref:tetratricopeptide repeat protein n=1 Tax=unclassified Bosea (in: a-proteobacteria) TaxID=2653178 RepID=UPI00083E5F2C|nr:MULTISPECIES: tetratricopeptide repeat protein [unclassified Bosea (in: a-proteobacteria)]MBA4268965.1 tetratricopeptide repeat protein [Methylobacterium sp.]MBX9875187.1 tetratricopeptide repeat protein [Beijerinckiaceae bacterium]MDP3603990.1 tetratricopeptide repeat protein [Bosea sp. (in: a-proteobacteria)]WRH57978.1 MAG: tetratricopeptide repeat protein [Bosea sp. (in: a-proteobacteria)]
MKSRGPITAAALALLLALPVGAAAQGATARSQEARSQDRLDTAESLEGNYLAAIVAGAGRDLGAAAVYLREAIKGDPQNNDLLERAFVAFLADGAMPDAFRAADKLIQRDPSNGLAQLAIGIRALKQKNYQTARNHLQRGGRGRAADITATLLSAWSQLGSGQPTRAIETLERLKGEASYNLFRDYHAGLILDAAGRKADAEKRLKAAYDSEKTTLRLVDLWARMQARNGDFDGAAATYSEFDRLLPNHPIVRDGLAKVAARQTPPRQVGTAQQGAAEVLYGLASAGNRQGDEAAALLYLRLAIYLDPNHDLAILTLGDILERARQPEDAVAVYEKMPDSSPLRPNAEIQAGLALENLGRPEEAVKHLNALIAERPDDIDALSALGNVYRSRKMFEEAAATYDKAIGKLASPGRANWDLFYFRGIARERIKRWSEAEADLRKALELLPEPLGRERALVLNYLGYSLVDQNLKLDEALGMLRRAVELRPRDGYIIDSLGWAYYRLGRYTEALRELERAVELRPSDPVINDHLGDVYWKVGRRLEAGFQWNHARDLNPEPEDLVKIKRKIERGLEDGPSANAVEPKDAAEPKKDGG